MRRSAAAVALAALLLTAGCAGLGGPDPGDDTPTATGTPGATDTPTGTDLSLVSQTGPLHQFDIYAAEGPLRRVTVRLANGTTRTVRNVSAVTGIYAFADRNATAVELPGRAEQVGSFTLGAGDSARTTLTDLPPAPTVVVVVSIDGRDLAWASYHCRDRGIRTLDFRWLGTTIGAGLSCAPTAG